MSNSKNIQTLREELLSDLEKIRSGEMPPNKAKAISGHINTIVNITKLELAYYHSIKNDATPITKSFFELPEQLNLEDKEFVGLLLENKPKIQGSIAKFIFNIDLREEIYQQASTKALLAYRQGRFDGSKKFANWFITIAKNLYTDEGRKKKKMPEVETEISEETSVFDLIDSEVANPEEEIISDELIRENRHLVEKMLQQLSDSEQVFIKLRFYENMSYEEIAEKQGVVLGTVSGTLDRCKKKMREWYEQEMQKV